MLSSPKMKKSTIDLEIFQVEFFNYYYNLLQRNCEAVQVTKQWTN